MGKYESGYQKRKRKEKEEDFINSQRGAMNRFIKKNHHKGHPVISHPVISQLILLLLHLQLFLPMILEMARLRQRQIISR